MMVAWASATVSAAAASRLSRLEGMFDRVAVDGLVNLVAKAVYALGDWGRTLQTGRLRNYLMVLAAAVVGLCALGCATPTRRAIASTGVPCSPPWANSWIAASISASRRSDAGTR